MKKIVMAFAFGVWVPGVYAQKITIDTSVVGNWQVVDGGKISADGKYVTYLKGINTNYFLAKKSVEVKALEGNWERKIENPVSGFLFSSDSRNLILKTDDNILHIIKLGSDEDQLVHDVASFELIGKEKDEVLGYTLSKKPDTYILRNLNSRAEISIENVVSQTVIPNGRGVLFVRRVIQGGFTLEWFVLGANKYEKIWKGRDSISKLIANSDGSRIAFQTRDGVFYYEKRAGITNPVRQLNLQHVPSGMVITNMERFSPKGKLLLFKLVRPAKETKKNVKIFDYRDRMFSLDPLPSESFMAVYDLTKNTFTQATFQPGEELQHVFDDDRKLLIKTGYQSEYYWNEKQKAHACLIELTTGLETKLNCNISLQLSPKEDYIIGCHNQFGSDIYSYEISTGKELNLTEKLPIPKYEGGNAPEDQFSRSLRFVSWFKNGTDILVKDYYDLWKIDIRGINPPENLTKGFGRQNKIIFNVTTRKSTEKIGEKERLVLSGCEEWSGNDGFYEMDVARGNIPKLLHKGPYAYTGSGISLYHDFPKKAENANVWLVNRSSSTESLNYFWTSDFKTFNPISKNYPERNYNWFTTEVIEYITKTGVKSRAVLYKPDNLDTTQKYPVLFNFYEQSNQWLNEFICPYYVGHGGLFFNYPIMLAQGYLVCVPDIRFKLGHTAESIVDCLEGAADEISKRRYVDSTKFGAAGGSFGGYGVNCLSAFSHKFKGIISVSGISDLVSIYGNVPGLRDEMVENRHCRMGVSLSTDPIAYIKNSPVAYTKETTTPILLVHGAHDGNVNPQQSIEYFISLRREGKPSWLLWYPNEGHGVQSNMEDQRDFYGRMTDFFNHYLKGAPAPAWMTDSTY